MFSFLEYLFRFGDIDVFVLCKSSQISNKNFSCHIHFNSSASTSPVFVVTRNSSVVSCFLSKYVDQPFVW